MQMPNGGDNNPFGSSSPSSSFGGGSGSSNGPSSSSSSSAPMDHGREHAESVQAALALLSTASSVDDLLNKADDMFQRCEYTICGKLYESVIQVDNTNLRATDGIANLLMEIGEVDAAREAFVRSVRLAPDSGPHKYLNLGQLLKGLEAIACYKKAVVMLSAERAAYTVEPVQTEEMKELVQDLNQQIASALCACVEVYLTDSCFEPDAESECQRLLSEAVQFDPTSPEVFQSAANFLMSQCKNADALAALRNSYTLWSGIQDTDKLPSFEFRTTTAKLFIELEQFAEAKTILEDLVEEQDSIAELWWLLYLTLMEIPGHEAKARRYLLKAKTLVDGVESEDVIGFKQAIYAAYDILQEEKRRGGAGGAFGGSGGSMDTSDRGI
eukprot:TRINITY_DN2697_c0_g2_i1.p1 TRINITY_DN2697_c0_g2~~TRINITY_DN2697_c0_g2_i1.p1  ORF type:complete len:384 (-),score=94.53 TRINITY_DN2697_c0_g2_i1:42-1193(-)